MSQLWLAFSGYQEWKKKMVQHGGLWQQRKGIGVVLPSEEMTNG